MLEGHANPITCMNFDVGGTYLASFSNLDHTLRIWKIGTAGIIEGILGMNGKHYKLVKTNPDLYKEGRDEKFTLVWENKNINKVQVVLKIGDDIIAICGV